MSILFELTFQNHDVTTKILVILDVGMKLNVGRIQIEK